MRSIKIQIGSRPVGEQQTWAYPNGNSLGRFLIPIYDCYVSGVNDAGATIRQHFQCLRFGVSCQDGKTASVVGLADQQSHIIKAWIPTYVVHSANSPENGAWQVYSNFLIHDGPDGSHEVFATIGCIEIMGVQGFVRFNDLIISLSGSTARDRNQKLAEIGRSGKLSITYERATRPALKKKP